MHLEHRAVRERLCNVSCSDVEFSRDWVVEVEGGLEEATRVAAEAELEVLGEVMEASNIFHLRQRRRVRRSAEDLHSQLQANTRVRSFSQQTVLKVGSGDHSITVYQRS